MKIKPMENWDKTFWRLNVPVQVWRVDKEDGGGYEIVNYMPRKQDCCVLEDTISEEELPAFCDNTAAVLRNLADLFEAMGKGEIGFVYYANENIDEAKKDWEKKKKEEE